MAARRAARAALGGAAQGIWDDLFENIAAGSSGSGGVDESLASVPDELVQALTLAVPIAVVLLIGYVLARVLPRVWRAVLFFGAWIMCQLAYNTLQNAMVRRWIGTLLQTAVQQLYGRFFGASSSSGGGGGDDGKGAARRV